MWTRFVRELRRRWQPTCVSVAMCAGLGALLRSVLQPGSSAGPLTWALLGVVCAVSVGLTWPLVVVLRGGVPHLEGTQASALEDLARRRRAPVRLGRVAVALVVVVAVGAVALAVYRANVGAVAPGPEAQHQAHAGQSHPPDGASATADPPSQPTIRIGNHILVRASSPTAATP